VDGVTGRGNPSGEGSPVDIGDLDREGRGVGRVHGKAVFVEGALPGEEVRLRYLRRRSRFDEAVLLDVLRCSPERVQPHCPHFGVCGGCRLQHLRHDAQVRAKRAARSTLRCWAGRRIGGFS
jgi:23S rRNA (uracil1939-C5)-methyltransferase